MDLDCQYCGEALNSTKHEWIITQLLSAQAYSSLANENELPLTTNAGVNDLDPLFKVRDYALNNVMLIVASDGVFSHEEVDFTTRLAKKLGYDNSKLAGMYDLAKNNQLTIRLPENRKGALKVYEMMLKAASTDGTISAEEQKILNDIQSRIALLAA
jgi:hypothetical protein